MTKSEIDRKYKTSNKGATRRRLQRAERRRTDPEYRRKLKEQAKRHRLNNGDKSRARNLLHHATNRGKIKSKPCMICGDSKSQAHHPNYLDPLNVIWFCFKHHREVQHGQQV